MTTLGSILWIYFASKSKTFLVLALLWAATQSILAIQGVYQHTEAMPPPMLLFGVLPALVIILLLFVTRRGRAFIDSLDLRKVTFFHTIRIPVEIVLALLYHQGVMSVLITFEGTNFDLFSGITAAIVGVIAFRPVFRRKLFLWWNIVCLLLLNVVITAALSIPSPIQQFAFDQPNVAVLYFPFNLLPTVVVPLVLMGHLVAFRRLRTKDVGRKVTIEEIAN